MSKRLSLPSVLFGCDGEDGPGAPAVEPGAVSEAPESTPKVFDEAYVKELRDEAAKARIEGKDLKSKLSELEEALNAYRDAERTEIEKATEKATREASEKEQLRADLFRERFERSVLGEATALRFINPENAVALVDRNRIEVDESTGRPDPKTVRAALDRLAKDQPHLVSTSVGSGDGGSKESVSTTDESTQRIVKELTNAGYVFPG